MREIFGTWGPELMTFSIRTRYAWLPAALGVTSIVLTLVFGKLSWSGDGSDSGGFYFGDGDGGCGD
jgi:hypothetical protein